MHVFGLQKEAIVPGENPHWPRENMIKITAAIFLAVLSFFWATEEIIKSMFFGKKNVCNATGERAQWYIMVFRRQRSFRNICTTDSDLCCLSDLAANRSPQFVLHKVEIKALNFHFKLERNTFGCVETLTIALLRALWNNLFKNALSPSPSLHRRLPHPPPPPQADIRSRDYIRLRYPPAGRWIPRIR